MAKAKNTGTREEKPVPVAEKTFRRVNLTRSKFSEQEDDGIRYRVANVTQLGGHKQGAIVSAIDLGPGADVGTLRERNLLIPLEDDEVNPPSEQEAAAEQPKTKGGVKTARKQGRVAHGDSGTDAAHDPDLATGDGAAAVKHPSGNPDPLDGGEE